MESSTWVSFGGANSPRFGTFQRIEELLLDTIIPRVPLTMAPGGGATASKLLVRHELRKMQDR